ncbi:MAG: hypothetical protein ABIG28_02350 [archaeon]
MVLGETSDATINLISGGLFGILIAIGILIGILFLLAIYAYFAIAWSTIARKLNYKYPWLSWIPFANGSMILELGGFHWAWIFLIMVPVLGWIALAVLMIIATWRIFEKRKYPGWFSLSIIIPKVGGILYLVILGFVAWGDKSGENHITPIKKAKKKIKKKKITTFW